ncbi:ADP-ribosylation/Crystallin J1 [Tribonema minus]|uniref:ADP-ribosylation/Crystallin J1 n=1 Tax=Tribonema minus TaxID=303371 RepID=A0A835ZGW4_9STRA|nr:ADP-ribosylation/Crystallin J1 [Tribonema minus]
MALTLAERVKACLGGMYIGDALAMPVHWYYDVRQLKRDFGRITQYEVPKPTFPGSIMNLSNTGGGGRGSDKGNVVGDVILHGKRKYWLKGGSYHYHHGMRKGQNTLDCWWRASSCAASLSRVITRRVFVMLRAMRSIAQSRHAMMLRTAADCLVARALMCSIAQSGGAFDEDAFRGAYVRLMTTPGAHDDAYAGTCHRMFFAKWARGVDPRECPDNDGHNVDAIDVLSAAAAAAAAGDAAPAAAAAAAAAREALSVQLARMIRVTRSSAVLPRFADNYARMLLAVLGGGDLRAAVQDAGAELGVDVPAMVRSNEDPMTACYITRAYPALLHYAYKYAEDPEAALLASTNAGGENVARGCLLGALLGAAHGLRAFPQRFVRDLDDADALYGEIDAFVAAVQQQCAL